MCVPVHICTHKKMKNSKIYLSSEFLVIEFPIVHFLQSAIYIYVYIYVCVYTYIDVNIMMDFLKTNTKHRIAVFSSLIKKNFPQFTSH